MISLSYSKIKKIVFPILAIPFIIFSIGWLKWYWAVLTSIAVVLCVYYGAYYKSEKKDNEIKISYWMLLIIVALAFIWVWQSGMGGFWAQSKDYPWRNAIFRDLVLFEWPVKYELYDGALVYYISFWLVPAIFGKIALLFGATDAMAFEVASVAIFLWGVILVTLLFLLLILIFKVTDKRQQFLVLIGFILFSGLDILGSIEPLGANLYHIEWWADICQYSSFTTCLFWVFNQSVIVWICMACLLQEKDIKNFVFLGMMCFFSGPLPFLMYFVYCLVWGIKYAIRYIKMHKVKQLMKSIFSIGNILSTVVIFPFIATYFLSSLGISGGAAIRIDATQLESMAGVETSTGGSEIITYILFILFEFGIFALLIVRKQYKSAIFWTTIVSLLIFPFIKIGYGSDFPMRASIPAIFMMYIMVYEFILKEKVQLLKKGTINRLLYILLIVCLVLGSITPIVEFYRGVRQVNLYGLDNPMEDYIYTLSGENVSEDKVLTAHMYGNFVSAKPNEHFFFQYFAK